MSTLSTTQYFEKPMIDNLGQEVEKKKEEEKRRERVLERHEIEELMCQEPGSLDLKLNELTSIEEIEIGKEWRITAKAIIPLKIYEGHFKNEAHVVPFGIIAGAATEAVDVFLTYLSKKNSKQEGKYDIFYLKRGQESIDTLDQFIIDKTKGGKNLCIEAVIKKEENNDYVADINVFTEKDQIVQIKGVSCFGIPRDAIANPDDHPESYMTSEEKISLSTFQDLKQLLENKDYNFEFWQDEDTNDLIGYLGYELLRKICSSDSPIFNVSQAIYKQGKILAVAEFPITHQSAGADFKKMQKMFQEKPTLPGNVPPTALIGDVLVTLDDLNVKNHQDLEDIDKNSDLIEKVPVANHAGNVERFRTDKLIQSPCQIIIEARIVDRKMKGKNVNFLLNMNMYLGKIKIGEMKDVNYKLISTGWLEHIRAFFKEERFVSKISV